CNWNIMDFLRLLLPSDWLKAIEHKRNTTDYGGLAFQLMGSLNSSQLAAAHSSMMKSTPLNDFRHNTIRTDSDYYYELIGTLALREGNYARAVLYLSDVSPEYLRTMNIYRYLQYEPFVIYPSRWRVDDEWEYEFAAGAKPTLSSENAKLTFARRLLDYVKDMRCGKTADDRGMARLMYAIGRFNSFEECWALTQYWRGVIPGKFSPNLRYDWDDDFAKRKYAFLYDYNTSTGHKHTEAIYNQEVEAALAMLTTDEARAKAQYILGNLKTITKRYPHTAIGHMVRSLCDHWNDWI
ncbi:MAG: hypothetical protein K2J17_05020, partial [Paramuribaculum sp.]|nr:hypothetical protein [Paramuribaculum sp.]